MTTNINQLTEQYPLVKELIELKEISWFNPSITSLEEGLPYVGLGVENIKDASDRLKRFAPYLVKAFPETAETSGIIESEVVAISEMQKVLEHEYDTQIQGRVLLKKTATYRFLAPLRLAVASMKS